MPNLKLGDYNDLVVVGSALNARAEILITGDEEIPDLAEKPKGLRISSPRDFWDMLSKERQRRVR